MDEGRKYYLDWLRVLAFGLLIPFHVAMLYVSWAYPLKSPRPLPELEWALMFFTPWRLALVFLISGVASRHLLGKLGPGGFARDRLARLLPVILFGMLVVNAPQTWTVATANGMTDAGFLEFWRAYVRGDHSVLKPPGMAMPRWDHLWFLLYLLPYALLLALVWKLKGARRLPAPPLRWLLLAPALWLAITSMLVDEVWPRTDALVNDWGQHLKWLGMFGVGVALAMRGDVWEWMRDHRVASLGAALVSGLLLAGDHALFLSGALSPPASWISYYLISGLFGWSGILAVCGFAARYLDRPSPSLSYLNTAILPVYVLHQPLLFLAAVRIFPLHLPLAVEMASLAAITMLGSLAIYHLAVRPFTAVRFLFGVKPRRFSAAGG